MKNLKYIILSSLLVCTLPMHSQEEPDLNALDPSATRSVSTTYSTASTTQADNSFTIQPKNVSSPPSSVNHTGGYLIAQSGTYTFYNNISFETNNKTTGNANTGILAGDATTRCVIRITVSNVTLSLQGFDLSTNIANLAAIYIEEGLQNVVITNGTITSGTQPFQYGIICGKNCSNIKIEDMVVEKIDDGTPISFDGDANGTRISNISLKNIASNSHTGTTGTALYFNFANQVFMENVTLGNSSTEAAFVACDMNNCIKTRISSSEASFNTTSHADDVILFSFSSCDNIMMEDIEIHNHSADFRTGIELSNCDVATFKNIDINNNISSSTAQATSAFTASTVNNLTIDGFYCSNTQQTGDQALNGIVFSGANTAVNINDYQFFNNTATAGTLTGFSCTASPDINVDNVKLFKNTSTAGIFNGMAVTSSPHAELTNINISNNVADDSTTAYNHVMTLTSSPNCYLGNINISRNTGGYEVQGVVLDGSHVCRLENIVVAYNEAETANIAKVGQTVGIMLKDSHYNIVKNCLAAYNLGGNHDGSAAVGTPTVDADAGTNFGLRLLAAGFVDYGSVATAPNHNNIFRECTAKGNQTKWANTGAPANVTSSGRYATQAALSAGFYLQATRGATIVDCKAELNGSYHATTLNAYVAGHGIHIESTALQSQIHGSEVSNHTWHGIYGFLSPLLSLFASSNIAYNNSTSTLAQDTTNGFGLSILDQNFHFPLLSENIPWNMAPTFDFSSATIEKKGENVIYYLVPDDSIAY